MILYNSSVKISAGQILQLWTEVPNYILRNPGEKPRLSLRYTRGGLIPGNQAKTLAVESINAKVIKPDLTTST